MIRWWQSLSKMVEDRNSVEETFLRMILEVKLPRFNNWWNVYNEESEQFPGLSLGHLEGLAVLWPEWGRKTVEQLWGIRHLEWESPSECINARIWWTAGYRHYKGLLYPSRLTSLPGVQMTSGVGWNPDQKVSKFRVHKNAPGMPNKSTDFLPCWFWFSKNCKKFQNLHFN